MAYVLIEYIPQRGRLINNIVGFFSLNYLPAKVIYIVMSCDKNGF